MIGFLRFDVAGAGACLKRYTDPSFFKIEAAASGKENVEIPREKKNRRFKVFYFIASNKHDFQNHISPTPPLEGT